MTRRSQVFKCQICGNIVEVLHEAGGTLVCCDEAMRLMEENTVDAAREKHVPVIEAADGGVKVKVGSVAHPMEAGHFIEWIEVTAGGRICTRFLKPGGAPEAGFRVDDTNVVARAYCNLHGHWKAGG